MRALYTPASIVGEANIVLDGCNMISHKHHLIINLNPRPSKTIQQWQSVKARATEVTVDSNETQKRENQTICGTRYKP